MSDAVIGGRYRLVERLASGGMGSVWKAWDERLQRTVAIKQLHVQLGLSDQDAHLATERAMREARLTARLHHPNAVQVFDVVDDNNRPCLVMEYVPSTSLQQIVATQGPRPAAEVARIGTQVAAALAAAHRAGIVHRDVKPGNILIGDDGSAKITDFGISHAFDDVALTSTGMVTGTPAYLAPEVARGAPSTPASDVFSLASTLFMAAEGTPPFGTDQNPIAVLHRVASGNTIPPTRIGPLGPVLRRMMAPDPAARPDMVEVANSLAGLPMRPGVSPTAPTEALSRPHPGADATRALPLGAGVAAAAGTGADGPPRRPPMIVAAEQPQRPERKSSFLVPFLAAAFVVVLGAVLAIVLIRNGSDDGAAAQQGTSVAPRNSSSAEPSTRSTPSTRKTTPKPTPNSKPTSAKPTSAKPTSAKPTSAKPTSAKPTSTKPSAKPTSTTPAPNGPATAAQLAGAITDYYALVPGNTEAGWQRLTANYQRTTSQGRDNYEKFWDTMSRVSVADVEASPPGTVTATLTYYLKTGKQIVNRTRFGLVREGGILKIDSSQVI